MEEFLKLPWLFIPIFIVELFLIVYFMTQNCEEYKITTGKEDLETLKNNFKTSLLLSQPITHNTIPIYPKARYIVHNCGDITMDCCLHHNYKELIVSDHFLLIDCQKNLDLQLRKESLMENMKKTVEDHLKEPYITNFSIIIKNNLK